MVITRLYALIFTATLSAAIGVLSANAQENIEQTVKPKQTTSKQYSFAILAGDLEPALVEFSTITGITVSFKPKTVNTLRSLGLKGNYDAMTGLTMLLQNTGLQALPQPNGSYTIDKIDADVTMLDPVLVNDSKLIESAYGPAKGYVAKRSATGTKTDTPLIETPVSVQVIARDVIDEQGAVNLKNIYENVSGVQQAGNTQNAQSEVFPIIRGFESPVLLRNGLRATAAGAVDLINIERVEVLKGPASILYGALEPGGVVNYVTKRPQSESSHVLKQELGSDAFLRTSLDSTAALNSSATWMYRLNAAYTDSDSFRDEIELKRTAIAPSFLWVPNENTDLLLDFSYTKEEQPYDSGIPLSGKGKPLVSDSTFFGDPDLNGRENEDYYASYQFSHQINAIWKVRNQLQIHRADNLNESIRNRGVRNNDTELRQRYQNEDRVEDETQFVIDGIAAFNTGDMEHQLLLGTELIEQETAWHRFRQNLPNAVISDDPSVNFNPPADQTLSDEPGSTDWWSVYAQDQISMLDGGRLKLLLGARFDDVKTNSKKDGVASKEVSDNAVTARAGLLYMLDEQKTVYFSASESFNPQSPGTLDRNGTPLDPETGMQIEIGIKTTFFEEKLISTVAIYQIEKDDVAVYDQEYFNDTGMDADYPGVKQRSQGVELDITGQLTPQINILANYSYTDTEVLENKEDPSQVGDRLGGVALNLARFWLTYDFSGDLAGLGLGGGARYVGESTSQFDDIPLDSYTTADLGLWYQWSHLRASLNVNNVFDEQYITRASDASIAHPGEPRSVLLGLSYAF